ncbi:AlbA family DNA-binding domain-containing protein [Sessilibacter corallicola]|uniref:Schlafen AlbA-2 domain-containing protein n=1 Tax=Sessilibacter corallicola TaxID=2904075 RepID=A0ABQ0A3X8_9GAMM
MQELVKNLIDQKKEGHWWDFKLKHHDNLHDLLHDILCLANVIHDGDRFIIFGVSDDYEINGLNDKNLRRTQADILNFLRTISFANNKIPNIKIDSLQINGKELDILTIRNENHKPYFLTKDETKKGTTVRAGTIYSRLGDSNTPKDSSANPEEIEKMWCQRFNLDKKASERFIDILVDYNNWKYDGISKAFYDIDPDFKIEIGSHEGKGGQYWWEESLAEKPYRFHYHLRYKSVELYKLLVVRFKNENLKIPFPNVEFINLPENDNNHEEKIYCDLFYYIKNTIEYSLFKHIRALETSKINHKSFSTPIQTQIKPPIIKLPFLILDSEDQLNIIHKKLTSNYSEFLQVKSKSNLLKTIDKQTDPRYAAEELFSEWAYDIAYKNNI